MKLLWCFMILAIIVQSTQSRRVLIDDAVQKLIRDAGYIGEAHEVETEDGYLLRVHRIFPAAKFMTQRKAILLFHGFFFTAADFVILGRDSAIAYLLADNGYDVWLGNARGNPYSENHRTLDPKSNEFWKFSWHEMGVFDLPAIINYIVMTSNVSKIFYIGHSQGTAILMVMLSMRPEFNQRIIQAHLLAPVAYLEHSNLPFRLILKPLLETGYSLGITHIDIAFTHTPVVLMKNLTCGGSGYHDYNCYTLFFLLTLIMGDNPNGMEIGPQVLRVLEDHVAPRVSLMQSLHLLQLVYSKNFTMFDYKDKNMAIYGREAVPSYELNNVRAPVFLYHAEHDKLVSGVDVDFLKTRLPNVRGHRVIPNWNHMDFSFAKNARNVLFLDILNTLGRRRQY